MRRTARRSAPPPVEMRDDAAQRARGGGQCQPRSAGGLFLQRLAALGQVPLLRLQLRHPLRPALGATRQRLRARTSTIRWVGILIQQPCSSMTATEYVPLCRLVA